MRALAVVPAFLLSCLVPALAWADEKQVCSDAYQQAQTLRDQHKLVKAREQLRVCARAECPGFIVKDCTTWLKDVDPRVPSVVLTAKNAAGADLTDVRVSVDGAPLVSKLDGIAVDVDPGSHVFAFEGADGRTEQSLVVTEGAKAQRIAVTLGAGGGTAVMASGGVAAAPAADASAASGRPAPTLFPAEAVDTGLSFGVRLGYGVSFGSIDSGQSISDVVSGQIPFWFDAGYLFSPNFYLGAYLSVGIATGLPTACNETGADCSGTDLRIGLNVQYRFLGKDTLQPWVGLGFLGYEGATVSSAAGSESVTGIDWVTPQAGFDYKILPTLSAGPYVGASIAEFLGVSESSSTGLSEPGASLGGKTLHGWIFFGVRASYDLHI